MREGNEPDDPPEGRSAKNDSEKSLKQAKRDLLDVHGILLLDKPVGLTSNQALQQAKRLLKARKAGHTGSLDPLASGLLPLCFGEATKVSRFLLEAGISTATGDADGEVTATRPVNVGRRDIERAIERFTGTIEQVPPMYSAVKLGGEPLYKLARAGLTAERTPRTVTVYEYEVLGLDGDRLHVQIRCSKGTYVRSLAHDLGELLGCGAHVAELRRTAMAGFAVDQAIPLAEFEALADPHARAARLVSADRALQAVPAVTISRHAAYYFCQGQPVVARPLPPGGGWLRVYEEDGEKGGRFLGLAEVDNDGRAAPRRLLHTMEGPDSAQKTG
jgi:tRNA pseudouridine55 synthase